MTAQSTPSLTTSPQTPTTKGAIDTDQPSCCRAFARTWYLSSFLSKAARSCPGWLSDG